MLHGNAGNRYHRLPWMDMLRSSLGVNVVMLDYRGYGGNPGEPSEEGLIADAEAAYSHVLSQLSARDSGDGSR